MSNEGENEPIISKQAEKGRCCHGKCHTESRFYRYTLMIFISMSCVGDYFCYDSPAALEEHILKDLDITESRYMLFYSSIQWTQMGACLFGGYLVDKVFGVRSSIVLVTTVLTLSQSLFAGGAMMGSYWTMVTARMIYGAMNGIQWLAFNKMNVKWFKDKELTFVIGLRMSLARAGTVANINLMDQIYSSFNRHFQGLVSLGLSLYVGAGVCFVAFLFSIGMFYLDKAAESFHSEPKTSHSKGGVMLENVRRFPVTYWFVALEMTFYLLAIFTFTGLGQVFFERKYALDLDIASNLNSLVYLIGACAMPPLGIVIDKVGRNLYWMFCGLILQLGCHLLLTFTFINPYVAMSLLGMSYSFMTLSTWPLIAYIVHMDSLGTAYGIVCALMAVGETGSSYFAGYLADNYGYISMEALILTFSSAAFSLGSLLFVIDNARAGNLNLTPSDRLLYDQKNPKKTE